MWMGLKKGSVGFVFLFCLGVGGWGGAIFSQPSPSVAYGRSKRRAAYRHYLSLRREISKRYSKARRGWLGTPCVSYFRMERYEQWLEKRKESLPQEDLSKSRLRWLKRRARSYGRYAARRKKQMFRRCRRYWKKEIKRNSSSLKPACQGLSQSSGRLVELWVGVRPWAHVYIDGKLCGTAPMHARLRPGSYKVRLEFPPGNDRHQTTLSLKKKPVLLLRFMKKAPTSSKGYDGLLSPEQLSWVVGQHKKSLRSCAIYQPEIHKVKLSWQIDTKGRPQAVRWVEPIEAKDRFRNCVLRSLQQWRFPKLKGIARIHAYPISVGP